MPDGKSNWVREPVVRQDPLVVKDDSATETNPDADIHQVEEDL